MAALRETARCAAEEQGVYDVVLRELERHAGTGCRARGALLAQVRRRYARPVTTRFSREHFFHAHWWGSEWVGHRPAQGPSAPQIGSQRLCIRE